VAVVTNTVVSADGKWLAAADGAANLWLWSMDHLDQPPRHLHDQCDLPTTLAISNDGGCLAGTTKGAESFLTVWDAPSGKVVGQLPNLHHNINCLALSARGQWLVSAGYLDANVYVWDVAAKKEVYRLQVAPNIGSAQLR
jgi:WD40 repeat protein